MCVALDRLDFKDSAQVATRDNADVNQVLSNSEDEALVAVQDRVAAEVMIDEDAWGHSGSSSDLGMHLCNVCRICMHCGATALTHKDKDHHRGRCRPVTTQSQGVNEGLPLCTPSRHAADRAL